MVNIPEFQEKLRSICTVNHWCLKLEYNGIWEIYVHDKHTGELLAFTGVTSIFVLPEILEIPFDKPPWT